MNPFFSYPNTTASPEAPNHGSTASERGFIVPILALFSYAIIGDNKNQFSGGKPGTIRNNAVIKAASLL